MAMRLLMGGFVALVLLAFCASTARAVDTDGDGLRDVIDATFRTENGTAYFSGIEDLDGLNLLTDGAIESLDFEDNHVRSIESGDFEGLANVRSLRLSENQISSLERDCFRGLTNLEFLRLDENQITSLGVGVFRGLAKLQSLMLDENQLTRVEDGGFEGLVNLRQLHLPNNQITSLGKGTFDHLTNLQLLGLRGNSLTKLESDTFSGLTQLQQLSLGDNQLVSLEDGLLKGMTALESIDMDGNQLTELAGDVFLGLTVLKEIRVWNNQLAELNNGVFNGLTSLETLLLWGNELYELNLHGATFQSLAPCQGDFGPGLCLDSTISALILDDAVLSRNSFDAILHETRFIVDASLVGLTFSDANPDDVSSLLGISSLDHVTVDQSFFNLYADEFNAFDAQQGNTLTVVPGLCDVNRDGSCDVTDINTFMQNILNGKNYAEELPTLIHRPMPGGFGTHFGDANLDNEFDSGDLINILAAETYEFDVDADWVSGDFDGNGRFDTGDLIFALADGGYEQGPRAAALSAVPEPTSMSSFLMCFLALSFRRR